MHLGFGDKIVLPPLLSRDPSSESPAGEVKNNEPDPYPDYEVCQLKDLLAPPTGKNAIIMPTINTSVSQRKRDHFATTLPGEITGVLN